MSDEALRKAEEGARKAIDDLFRKDWRLRRLLDFTRPYRVQARRLQRMESRAERERSAEIHLVVAKAIAEIPNWDESFLGPRAESVAHSMAMADSIAPRRGQRPKFTNDFADRRERCVQRRQNERKRPRSEVSESNSRHPITPFPQLGIAEFMKNVRISTNC